VTANDWNPAICSRSRPARSRARTTSPSEAPWSKLCCA